jgi:PAS domain S-box-containing protein
MASLPHGFEEPGDVQDIRLVVDTIPTLAWSAGPDGSADFFNQRWLDYTGLSAEQALGWGWEVAIHPDDLPRILETFREALNSVKPFEVEGRFRRFDGEFRWFLFRASPLRDQSGKVAKWYGTNTDLEERKRAEDALRKSEERWRSVFENSAIGVAAYLLNHVAQRWFRYQGAAGTTAALHHPKHNERLNPGHFGAKTYCEQQGCGDDTFKFTRR